MITAIDRNLNRLITADVARKESSFMCPICRGQVYLRDCLDKVKHFAHYPCEHTVDGTLRECPMSLKSRTESEWRRKFKMTFPPDEIDQIVTDGATRVIADVVVNDVVVEFVSTIRNRDFFEKRNKFYLGLGKKVIWLIDCRGQDIVKIGKWDQYIWNQRPNMLDSFSPIDKYEPQNNMVRVFIQVKDSASRANRGTEIFEITNRWNNWERLTLKNGTTEHAFRNWILQKQISITQQGTEGPGYIANWKSIQAILQESKADVLFAINGFTGKKVKVGRKYAKEVPVFGVYLEKSCTEMAKDMKKNAGRTEEIEDWEKNEWVLEFKYPED